MNKELKFDEQVNVTKPKLPPFQSYVEKIKSVWDSNWLTNNGPIHEEFKQKLRTYLNSENIELFVNGHLALETALKTLGGKGEVITTPFTFASTIHAITNAGLKPVFCDIEPENFNIDSSLLEQHITEHTKAIVAVHVFGYPCDVYKIEEISKKYNLKVIYDAAHAFGVTVNGKSITDFGDLSMFSMHATKVFHSIEGGILSFKNRDLAETLKSMKNFGINSHNDDIEMIGTNAKLNEFQAAMGLINLKSIDEEISKRKKIYSIYIRHLKDIKEIAYQAELENIAHNYSYFPILVENNKLRDYLFEEVKKYNLNLRKYFYPLCNDFSCYDYDSKQTPVAKDISDRILALPMYSDLKEEAIVKIIKIIEHETNIFNKKMLSVLY
ncbi:DegT/DnrJ/EryC1/StrS family aminotransferase [Bacillus vallismortis]|uniref:DegT/DnrJ/EryC1/StrS family aminotransferase n=1 Tax=Bacillus vallismortis TaxID=72361 RepID=UPI002DC02EDD|nr:DegT/DnrJ/EryC1/StrS family aminotransferase [Bacillus vallismortis]MEC1792518.1 DegT/DnrJ/EryC1/StrS family aminotransferase [Bacillus vallismortis]